MNARSFVHAEYKRLKSEMAALAERTLKTRLEYNSYLVEHGKYRAMADHAERLEKILKTEIYDDANDL